MLRNVGVVVSLSGALIGSFLIFWYAAALPLPPLFNNALTYSPTPLMRSLHSSISL